MRWIHLQKEITPEINVNVKVGPISEQKYHAELKRIKAVYHKEVSDAYCKCQVDEAKLEAKLEAM